MSGWTHGKAVLDGVVQYLSVSAIQAADSSRNNGCLRWWFYRYIYGIKEPPSKSLERGIKGHAEIENYLKTSDRAGLSSLVLTGFHLLPPPGPGISVEHSIVPLDAAGNEDLELAPLRVAGIPMVGKIDVLNWRGLNYGGTDITETHDPPGTIETIDHKFVGRLDNAKTGPQLVDEIQMAGYGEYVFRMAPTLERVRLSHNYFPGSGAPRKATILVDREKLQPAWKRAEAIAVSIRDAARETNPDRVDANTRACHRYGRDCPARSVCTAGMHNSLSDLIGTTAAERSLTASSQASHLIPTTLSGLPDMQPAPTSLFAQLQARQAQAAPVAAYSAAFAPPPPAAEVAAEVARLQALEAQVAPAPAPPSPATVNPLVAILQEIAQIAPHYNIGSPQFSGMAAVLIAQAKGYALSPGAGIAGGAGQLAQYNITEPAQIQMVLDQMRVMYAKGAAAVQAAPDPAAQAAPNQAVQAPNAPASNPAAPLEESIAKKAAEKAAKAAEKVAKKALEAAKKAADAAPTPPPAPTALPLALAPAPALPATPTTEVISAVAASASLIASLTAELAAAKEALAAVPVATPTTSTAYTIFVDCIVDGGDVKPLWPYVERVIAEMNRLSGRPDFRNVSKDSEFAFNGWAGFIAAFLNDLVARGQLPPGSYLLDTANGPIAAVVLETMRSIAHRTGGQIVRGQ